MCDKTTPQDDAAMPPASAGSHCLALLIGAAKLVTLMSCLLAVQVRCNPGNLCTHWPVAWVNVQGVTQAEFYIPPNGAVMVRLNWME